MGKYWRGLADAGKMKWGIIPVVVAHETGLRAIRHSGLVGHFGHHNVLADLGLEVVQARPRQCMKWGGPLAGKKACP